MTKLPKFTFIFSNSVNKFKDETEEDKKVLLYFIEQMESMHEQSEPRKTQIRGDNIYYERVRKLESLKIACLRCYYSYKKEKSYSMTGLLEHINDRFDGSRTQFALLNKYTIRDVNDWIDNDYYVFEQGIFAELRRLR